MAANLVFMGGKGEWPKSYVIPSVVLSLASVGLLVWHFIDPAKQIDAWTVTLFVVAFLPWLRTVFESIDFPGGGSVKYRQLEAKQERQQDEIDAMRFLVANFLPAEQKRVLRRFAEDGPYELGTDQSSQRAVTAVSALGAAGLIGRNPDLTAENVQKLLADQSNDLKAIYRITELGREYLKHLDRADQ